jgi:hypothetical protein
MLDLLSYREVVILRDAARDPEGRAWLNTSDGSAAVRLQERGFGHWEQTHPFVASFLINDAGRRATSNQPESPAGKGQP